MNVPRYADIATEDESWTPEDIYIRWDKGMTKSRIGLELGIGPSTVTRYLHWRDNHIRLPKLPRKRLERQKYAGYNETRPETA